LNVPIYSEVTDDGFPPGVDSWMGMLSFLAGDEAKVVVNAKGWWSCPAFVSAKKIEPDGKVYPEGFEKDKDGTTRMKNARIRNRGELAVWLKTYEVYGLAQFLADKVLESKKMMWKV